MAEYSKKELIEQLDKVEVDGKVSLSEIDNLVFDSKFPNELFQNALNILPQLHKDEKKYKELLNSCLSNLRNSIEIQTKINILNSELLNLESDIKLNEIEIKAIIEKYEKSIR